MGKNNPWRKLLRIKLPDGHKIMRVTRNHFSRITQMNFSETTGCVTFLYVSLLSRDLVTVVTRFYDGRHTILRRSSHELATVVARYHEDFSVVVMVWPWRSSARFGVASSVSTARFFRCSQPVVPSFAHSCLYSRSVKDGKTCANYLHAIVISTNFGVKFVGKQL